MQQQRKVIAGSLLQQQHQPKQKQQVKPHQHQHCLSHRYRQQRQQCHFLRFTKMSSHFLTFIAGTFLLHKIIPISAEEGSINWIASKPAWLDYGQQANITFSFSPPCKNIKFFKRGADGCCHFGRGCWYSPALTQRSLTRENSEFVAKNVTSSANGHYYAVCSDPIRLYRSDYYTGKNDWNLAIGVKPKIFSIEFISPDKTITSLERRKNYLGEVLYEAAVFVPAGKLTLIFSVGRGHNPNSSATHEDFVFYVPEFEAATENYGYDFIQTKEPKEFMPMPNYPPGYRYRYLFKRASLSEHNLCHIKGNAIAALGNLQIEQISFKLNISFDPFVSNITVEKVDDGNNVPACLFTCKAGACPGKANLTYEWSIYSTEWPTYNGRNSSSYTGPLQIKRNQLLVDGNECRSLFTELSSNLLLGEYQVSCRVNLPTGQWSQKSVTLKPLLSKIYASEEQNEPMATLETIVKINDETLLTSLENTVVKVTAEEVCSNSILNCYRLSVEAESEAHPCDASRCVFRCNPRCGNHYCLDHYCWKSNANSTTSRTTSTFETSTNLFDSIETDQESGSGSLLAD